MNVDAASLLAKVNVAEALWLEAGGPEAIVVCGGTLSIVHVYVVGGPSRTSQVAYTAKVCDPSPRAL